MKLTIIVPDSTVGIDGEFRKLTLPDMGNIRVVQWDGIKGHIEKTDLTNVKLTNINDYTSIIGLWNALTPIPVEPTPPTLPELIKQFTDAVQAHLDAGAKTLGYDGILSACSYAVSTNLPFSVEGKSCLDWRDAVWLYCYAELAKVEAGTRPMPTIEQIISELPARI